ncbi:hypothetical protein LTR62_003071 [Meristemomyces frigidus]|uniref:Clr5 domain-containing protein n=1 Tax=Meristemomyces frigidus TaxID=1508187 RepID=A0AAN7TFC3_9PEZI|nr:hypothetical protein LTR62_003071 [Meristemomyces frigidus]
MGRPPKYDWEDKKDICYQLFVEERKTPREIAEYFANHFNVPKDQIPTPRMFRRQFSAKWAFPRRGHRLKAEDEAAVVERIRELWEQNHPVKEIRELMLDEGWDMGEPEFQRLRRRNGFYRRSTTGSYESKNKKRTAQDGLVDNEEEEDGAAVESATAAANALLATQQPGLPAEELARRQQHLAQIQLESDQALLTRKRRRRIRGYGHLPADDPGIPPRYDSETTLDECKAFLHLNNEMYEKMRDEYEVICTEMNIERKKTNIENGQWQVSKDRLVRESVHLSSIMHPLQPNLDAKANAIDVICGDVTKRIRDRGKRFTMAEANNLLGLNPTASKDIRRAMYDILEADQYTTRLACGTERWNMLRERWFSTSPILQQVVAEADPQKMRAVECLCRDSVKRRNDDRLRNDPEHRQYHRKHYGPGPGSARGTRGSAKKKLDAAAAQREANQEQSTKLYDPTRGVFQPQAQSVKNVSQPQVVAPPAPMLRSTTATNTIPNPLIDPSLSTLTPLPLPPSEPELPAIPAYFRLSPHPSQNLIGHHPRLWLAKLSSRTLTALHTAACSKAGAATVASVQGLVRNVDGSEDLYPVESDEDLEVYLMGLEGQATFVVGFAGGYA